MEKAGIVETKEALKGLLKLTALLAEKFKDGVQVQDAVAIYEKLKADAELNACLVEAYNGIDKVPSEVKDLDVTEAAEIAMICLAEIPKVIKAIKA